MDVDDLVWGLLLLTNTAWAMFTIYTLMLSQAKGETWEPVVLGAKKKKTVKPKKDKKVVKVESQALLDELKELQKKYEKAKNRRDTCSKELDTVSETQTEERTKLELELDRLTTKYTDQKEMVSTLKERITKYGQRGAIIQDRLKLNKELIEEDGKQLEKLQQQVEDAKQQMERAHDDSSALKKAKNEVNKKLKTSTSEVSQLNYKTKGLFFKINRLNGENDYLKREIDRVTRRNRAASDRRGKGNYGRKGGKGSKRGGGKGYNRWGQDDDDDDRAQSRFSNYRPRRSHSYDDHHRTDEAPDYSPREEEPPRPPSIPPPSPPADPLKPGISEILEKAMGDPVGRWMDDFEDGTAW